MNQRVKLSSVLALTIITVLTLSSPTSAVQKKEKRKAPPPSGTPVLWRAHADASSLDLFNGPGGAAMRPDLRRVTFLKVETGGFSTKYRVKDGAGREWVAKIGNEAQSETAAVRLVWAAGFQTEINYLAPCVRIEGAPPPKEAERCGGGGFSNVRFEARPDEWDRLDEWKWDDKRNPFYGTKELQGLVVLNALLNNWDLKSSNNKVIYVPTARGGELRYVISDLGATFGKTGNLPIVWRFTRSRNKPEDFAGGHLVDEVKGRNVFLHYGGKNQTLFDDIYVEEARWVGTLLSRLSDRQIADAFRAANYAPDEVQMLAGAVRARVDELVNLSTPAIVGRSR
ncbi:MAG TPA: hypothetical protein VFS10_07880 [Pyrinomonadaceae bacterium]|nr:hypothetical protein [Pyrinomonadaceae bacterium]